MRRGLRLLRRTGVRVALARGGLFGMMQTLVVQGMTLVVNLATGVITARVLGPTGRGEFASAGLWILLPSLLALVGLQNAVVYEIRRRPAAAASISIAAFGLATALYIPIALVSLWFIPHLMHGYDPAIVNLARFAVLGSLLNVWALLTGPVLLGTQNVHVYNISTYSVAAAYLLLLLILVVFHVLTPTTGIFAMLLSTVFVLIPTSWWISRRLHWRDLQPLAFVRPLFHYSAKAAATDVVAVLYQHIDRLILVGLVSPTAFGLYAVAISFARTLMALQRAVSSVALADLSNRPAPEIELYIHRAFRALLWILAAVCVAGLIFGGALLRWIFGQHFGAAVPIFHILLIDASLTCLGQLLIEAFLASGKPTYPSTVQVISLGITATALLLLAPTYGGIGAAAAMVCGSGLRLLLLFAGLRRIRLRIPNPIPCASDIRALLASLRAHDGSPATARSSSGT